MGDWRHLVLIAEGVRVVVEEWCSGGGCMGWQWLRSVSVCSLEGYVRVKLWMGFGREVAWYTLAFVLVGSEVQVCRPTYDDQSEDGHARMPL